MNLEPHIKGEPCYNRPPYRDSKKKTVVKSYSISQESLYLIIFGVPSLNLKKNIKNKCKEYGDVERFYQITDHVGIERFTEAYAVKYSKLSESRFAKQKLDDLSFFGSLLHVVFAPELETVAECRLKLHTRRCQVRIQQQRGEKFQNQLIDKTEINYCQVNTGSTVEPLITNQHYCSSINTTAFPLTQNMNTANNVIKQAYCIQSSFVNRPLHSDIPVNMNDNKTFSSLIPVKVIRNLKRHPSEHGSSGETCKISKL